MSAEQSRYMRIGEMLTFLREADWAAQMAAQAQALLEH